MAAQYQMQEQGAEQMLTDHGLVVHGKGKSRNVLENMVQRKTNPKVRITTEEMIFWMSWRRYLEVEEMKKI